MTVTSSSSSSNPPSSKLKPPSYPPSETSKLIKTANVIQKYFNAESEMFGRSHSAGDTSPSKGKGTSNPPRLSQSEGDRNSESDEELETFKRYLYSDGSRSVKEVGMLEKFVSSTTPTLATKLQPGRSTGAKLDVTGFMSPPPNTFRAVKSESDLVDEENEQKEEIDRGLLNIASPEGRLDVDIIAGARRTRQYVTSGKPNTSRPTAGNSSNIVVATPLKTDSDEFQSLGEPYRAYARRSRLRSPGGALTSPDQSVDSMDGTQSNISTPSASNQARTLSSRARRVLKEKRERRKGSAVGEEGMTGTSNKSVIWGNSKSEVFAKILKDRVRGSSKQMKQNVANERVEAAVSSIEQDKSLTGDSPVDKLGTRRPQTVNLMPALPKPSDNISDVCDSQQHQTTTLSYDEPQGRPASDEILQKSSMGGSVGFASMDESSYSEAKATDLFDIGEEISSITSLLDHASESEVGAFPRRGASSPGCQVFELMNPLPIFESAFSALNIGSDTVQNVFFGNPSRSASNAFRDEVQSDEDVAIEVEYVEQAEAQYAGNDSGSITESSRSE